MTKEYIIKRARELEAQIEKLRKEKRYQEIMPLSAEVEDLRTEYKKNYSVKFN